MRGADRSEAAVANAGILPAMRAGRPRFRSHRQDLGVIPFANRTGRWIAAWSEAGLGAATLLFFPLLVLVPRGMAALASVAGLCAAGLVLSTSRNRLSPALTLPAMLLGCLLLWGTASALWSVDPIRTLAVAARLAGLFAAG